MDPENPVVKLCAEGMQAEAEGRPDDARRLFERAWDASTDGFEAAIAAHYLARHQPSVEDALRWNHEALARAEAADDARVLPFYPSLLLNLGYSHETLGDPAEARRHYTRALAHLNALPADPYLDFVRHGVRAGLERTGEAGV